MARGVRTRGISRAEMRRRMDLQKDQFLEDKWSDPDIAPQVPDFDGRSGLQVDLPEDFTEMLLEYGPSTARLCIRFDNGKR